METIVNFFLQNISVISILGGGVLFWIFYWLFAPVSVTMSLLLPGLGWIILALMVLFPVILPIAAPFIYLIFVVG